MMNFKNRNGFLLLEAVFATFIVGMIMGPLFLSQNNVLMHLSAGLARVQRLYCAKDFLLHTVLQQPADAQSTPMVEKKVEDPAVNLIFTQELVQTASSLSSIKHLQLAKVTFAWEWANTGKSDVISLIVFRPPPLPPAQQEKK